MLGSSSRCVELFPCAVFWQTLRPWRVRYHRAREFPARHPHCSLAIRVLIRHNDIGLHEIQARFHSPRPANTELTSFWTTQLLLKFHSRWSKRLTMRCGQPLAVPMSLFRMTSTRALQITLAPALA